VSTFIFFPFSTKRVHKKHALAQVGQQFFFFFYKTSWPTIIHFTCWGSAYINYKI